MRVIFSFACALFLFGCTSFNAAMTPSTSSAVDPFDGSIVVTQPPVSASSSLGENFHSLGFAWSKKVPDEVVITVGAAGYRAITDVAFNADGKMITNAKAVHAVSRYENSWTFRDYSMRLDDLLTIARAKSVKMKLQRVTESGVSSFGPAHGALVDVKLAEFIKEVEKNK